MKGVRQRVSFKIGLAVGGLVLVVALGQWLAFRLALETHHRTIRDSALEPGFRFARSAVRSQDGDVALPEGLQGTQGFALALYDADGALVETSSETLAVPAILSSDIRRLADAHPDSFEHVEEPSLTSDTAIVGVLPGAHDGGRGAPRYLAFHEVATQSAWTRVRMESLVVSLVFLPLAALITTLLLARLIRTRIKRAQAVVHRIAEGDLDVRLPPLTDDEIGELVGDFNRMADRLAALVSTLREQEEQRRRLFAAFTHELNTPLTSVLGYLESLQMDDVDADVATRRRYVSVAYEQARALESLASDIETLSRLDFEGVHLEREEVDVSALARAEVAALAPRAEQRGVQVDVVTAESPSASVAASVDPLRMGQVLRNVLDNAIRHSPRGQTVTVRVGGDEHEAQVVVRDTGDGIAPEHLARLGEPLYRVDPSRTRGTGGRGLGIAIARGLVMAHGGRFEIDSEVGRGTAVSVFVPRDANPTVRQR